MSVLNDVRIYKCGCYINVGVTSSVNRCMLVVHARAGLHVLCEQVHIDDVQVLPEPGHGEEIVQCH